MAEENVRAKLTVAEPVATVFAVLADPTTHAAIDGTGWVQQPIDPEQLTETGQVFRMNMYHPNHPDGDYQVSNQVHVLDAPNAIGWRPGTEPEQGEGGLEFGGWTWRYDLTPLSDSETEVTLTYDWSAVPASVREYIEFPPFGPEHLINSLQHLAELAARGEGAAPRSASTASTEMWGTAKLTIREGKLEDVKRLVARATEIVRTQDSGTIEYAIFINDAGTECFVHERYRDSAAGLEHSANIAPLMEEFLAACTMTGEVCGSPSPELRQALESGGVTIFKPL